MATRNWLQMDPAASKRSRIETRPDVERASILVWIKHMESKGEKLNGLMLRAK
ncbi:hypothetical protein C8R48DRAFT_718653 [Suillus tomentosus]|nr:hypothetical protein C8R48DRAFT_718653 [Suillus tomentosus]